MNTANIHLQFEDLITIYLANGLSGPEKVQFETHQTGCEPCRQSLAEARRFEESLAKTLEPDRAPAGLEDQLVKSFRLAFPQTVKRNWLSAIVGRIYHSSAPRFVGIAAGLFVLVIAGMATMGNFKIIEKKAMFRPPYVKIENDGNAVSYYTPWGGESVTCLLPTDKLVSEEMERQKESDSVVTTTDIPNTKVPVLGDIPIMGSLFGEKKKESDKLSYDLSVNTDIGVGGGGAAGRYGGQTGGRANIIEKGYARERAPREDPNLRGASAVGEPLNPDRKIIKSGTLAFEVDSFETAYQQVVAILTEERGYIASSSTTKLPNGKVRGQIVIRVLPERFDSVTLKLRSLGELKNQNVTSEDVTKQYVDLMARLKNSQALEERLVKLMKEKKGEIKDLLEVEKELANTREKIERLQGEIKYYDNLTSLATLTLDIMEKDIGKPVEYVETQAANLVLVVADVESAYPKAQAAIHSAKGQITQGQIERQNKRATGQILAYADAEQFTGLLEQLKILGEVRNFIVEQKQTAPEGVPAVVDNTKVRKERGLINLTLMPPAGEYIKTQQSKVVLETADVDGIYTKAQSIASDAQAKITNAKLNRYADYNVATVVCQVEADRFQSLMDSLKGLGKVLASETVEHQQANGVDPKSVIPAPVRKDPGTIELTIKSPSAIVESDRGVLATLKNTLKGSIKGLLWSLQMLVVGLVTVGPWLVVLVLVVILYRRLFRCPTK